MSWSKWKAHIENLLNLSRSELMAFFKGICTRLSKPRGILIAMILIIFVACSFLWIRIQELNLSQQQLSATEAETLINWELNRQLQLIVVVLTTTIALVRFTQTSKEIEESILLTHIGLAVIQIIFLARLVQSFQFVMLWEWYLSRAMYCHIRSKWIIYKFLFYSKGNLNLWGWILAIVIISLFGFLWWYRLSVTDGRKAKE